MKARCIENATQNTIFTLEQEYELSTEGLYSDLGPFWIHFSSLNRPERFVDGNTFYFGMCKFKIVNERNGYYGRTKDW